MKVPPLDLQTQYASIRGDVAAPAVGAAYKGHAAGTIDRAAGEIVALPIDPQLTEAQQAYVVRSLAEALA